MRLRGGIGADGLRGRLVDRLINMSFESSRYILYSKTILALTFLFFDFNLHCPYETRWLNLGPGLGLALACAVLCCTVLCCAVSTYFVIHLQSFSQHY
jgi:hypothetical protein